jgi:hypothetical protein
MGCGNNMIFRHQLPKVKVVVFTGAPHDTRSLSSDDSKESGL